MTVEERKAWQKVLRGNGGFTNTMCASVLSDVLATVPKNDPMVIQAKKAKMTQDLAELSAILDTAVLQKNKRGG